MASAAQAQEGIAHGRLQLARPTGAEEASPVAGGEPPGRSGSSSTGLGGGPHVARSGVRRRVAGVGRLSWGGCDERSADRGAATVWVIGGIAVLMAVVYLVIWFIGAVVARHEAEGAADLGALAAAVVAVDGEQAACAEARWVVERMGAVLLSCRLSGWDALVEAEVGYAPFGSAAARARAGPVEPHG